MTGRSRVVEIASRPTCLLVAVIFSATFATPIASQALLARENGDVKSQVRRLVRQLDDPQLEVRDEAERALIELGAETLDLLPPPDRQPSEEVRHRLARVRETIERTTALASLKGSEVTLSGEDLELANVLADIASETGNQFEVDVNEEAGTETGGLDVAFEATPFWEALDTLLDQAGATVYHYNRADVLDIRSAGSGLTPRVGSASYAGPFRIEPTSIVARRDLRTENHSLRLTLEIAWEPRLAPIALKLPLDLIEATDEEGGSIDIGESETMMPIDVQGSSSAAEVTIPLSVPSRDLTKIARLRGTLRALVPGRVETFRFETLGVERSAEQTKGDVTVALDEVRRNNDLWDVRVRVDFQDAAEAIESHRGWIYQNERYVLTGADERVEELAMELTAQTRDAVGFVFAFDLPDGPQGASFVYKTPVMFVELPIEFELKDIELP